MDKFEQDDLMFILNGINTESPEPNLAFSYLKNQLKNIKSSEDEVVHSLYEMGEELIDLLNKFYDTKDKSYGKKADQKISEMWEIHYKIERNSK